MSNLKCELDDWPDSVTTSVEGISLYDNEDRTMYITEKQFNQMLETIYNLSKQVAPKEQDK